MITGKTLIEWGFKPGPKFSEMLTAANTALEHGDDMVAILTSLKEIASAPITTLPLRSVPNQWHSNIDNPETPHEADNIVTVAKHMGELMRTPTLVAGAIMPDACPAGAAPGTIPVGGVVAAKDAIHPGMHSADICCSMAYTSLTSCDPKAVLDAAMKVTHFGPGGRPRGAQWRPSDLVMGWFERNPFLQPLMSQAIEHFGTQGDGNHFFYVGLIEEGANTRPVIVTHHGSRGPGAKLYKAGMVVAERYRRQISPETPKHNAWIPAESDEGRAYWDALQIIREWTKESHFAIHDAVIGALNERACVRFWNEHNFVFRRDDGLYYHAKGATPAYKGFAADDCGLTLIPLNMAQPILIARGGDAPHGLGFAPHGAGRNFSRTAYMRTLGDRAAAEIVAEQAPGIDARFYSGTPDLSELPLAYKDAASVRRQIESFGLAEIVDEIRPYGSIMAGHTTWRRK